MHSSKALFTLFMLFTLSTLFILCCTLRPSSNQGYPLFLLLCCTLLVPLSVSCVHSAQHCLVFLAPVDTLVGPCNMYAHNLIVMLLNGCDRQGQSMERKA